jgi:hypothetical protein
VLLSISNGIAQINTSPEFIQGTDTLVVYTDVPELAPSEFYTIKVRSAATNNQWVGIYANITRSLWSTIPISGTGNKEHYYAYVKDWSHTYANIEMGKNTKVDVQIVAKNNFKIRPTVYPNGFTKASIHPEGKARDVIVDAQGNVTFTIYEPGQFTVDINGQMDEVNTGNGYSGPPIHTISIFANPYMKKPVIDETVQVVEPGVKPSPLLGTKKTLYFKPGVHDIDRDFRIYANKNYYIPGDAIVYGTFSNESINNDNPGSSGANIKIYGYGTLSGDRIKHALYDPAYTTVGSPYYQNDKSWKLIWAVNCTNFVVDGLNLMNTPKHTAVLVPINSNKNETFGRWLKMITWRANGDGFGPHYLTDTFFRCQDDCTYIVGDRLRCVFWTDVNGTAIMMAQMPPKTERKVLVADCDVIYPRHNSLTWAGGRVFSRRGEQAPKGTGTEIVDVTFRDIRITDPFQTLETFSLLSTSNNGTSKGFSGIKFENITAVKTPTAGQNRILGHVDGPWSDVTFCNVVLGTKKIESVNDLVINSYVTNLKFNTCTLGIGNNFKASKENSSIVYPNPASNLLNIDFSTAGTTKEIKIYNLLGQLVYSTKTDNDKITLDVQALNVKGAVIVETKENNEVSNHKVILQ